MRTPSVFEDAFGVKVGGDYAFVVGDEGSLTVINVSNPLSFCLLPPSRLAVLPLQVGIELQARTVPDLPKLSDRVFGGGCAY